MNRRDFVKISAPLSATPLLMNGIPLKTFATTRMVQQLCEEVNERVLVIVHLNGGNDGISNFIPVNQYDTYAYARPNIKIPINKLTQLDTTLPLKDQSYVHPSLIKFKEMYEDGLLNIVRGVGYPQPNKSHFKARDLWMEGRDGIDSDKSTDGWIARYLYSRYPNYKGKPFANMPDPLGIILGRAIQTGFHTFEEHAIDINLSGQDPEGYFNQISNISGAPILNVPDTDQGKMLEHIMRVESSLNLYAGRITEVFLKGKNSNVEYAENELQNQFKTIARLLNGGSQTKVFMCTIGGWDTHNTQVEESDTSTGEHAELLSGIADAVKIFQQDLANLQQDHRVMTVFFSEFGRKVIQNGSRGTDHGTLGPMYIFGKGVNAGITGSNLDLNNRDEQDAPNPEQTQYDYRQVFGSLLQDWLGASNENLNAIRFASYTTGKKLDLINNQFKVDPSCYLSTAVPSVKAKIMVMLEGFIQKENGKMHTKLRQQGLIPVEHPFKEAPFNYDGNEKIGHNNPNVVDWVYIEVRDSNDLNKILAKQAALLDSEGNVRNTSYEDALTFTKLAAGEYYVAVYHKSHIGVLSAEKVSFSTGNPVQYDFTDKAAAAKGNNQLKDISGRYVMLNGDFDQNGIINNLDFNEWKKNGAAIDEYLAIDADGSGIVNNLDFNQWRTNKSRIGINEIKN